MSTKQEQPQPREKQRKSNKKITKNKIATGTSTIMKLKEAHNLYITLHLQVYR